MRAWALILKNLREQFRSPFILSLTLLMGPFFLFVYYLIMDSYSMDLQLIVMSRDPGISISHSEAGEGEGLYYEDKLLFGERVATFSEEGYGDIPLLISIIEYSSADSLETVDRLKESKADAFLILGRGFSRIFSEDEVGKGGIPELELIGDLRSAEYLLTAVLAEDILNRSIQMILGRSADFQLRELPLGQSGSVTEFEAMVPGLLVLSMIMLMFSAGIAFVHEAEHGTLIRMQLAQVPPLVYLSGVSAVQILIGLASMGLTLFTARILGADLSGAFVPVLLVSVLCSLSIIAFSLLLAALTRSANEILVLGNFPMFLFMFFSGAAFPMKGSAWFEIAGYPVGLQGLMSATHAVTALNKLMIMDRSMAHILPEITALILLTVLYAVLGALIFRKRHM